MQIIVAALRRFGIEAYPAGRNDILVGDRKVSGSAFQELPNRVLHHGTLLIDADLTKLADYLTPDKKKLEAKGLSSVKSRVANLREFSSCINHENLSEALICEFCSDCPVEKLDVDRLQSLPDLAKVYARMQSWEWRFGKTPPFTQRLATRFPWGSVDVYVDAHKGLIENANIYSDSLFPDMIDALSGVLRKVRYEKNAVDSSIAALRVEFPHLSQELQEFSAWFGSQIVD